MGWGSFFRDPAGGQAKSSKGTTALRRGSLDEAKPGNWAWCRRPSSTLGSFSEILKVSAGKAEKNNGNRSAHAPDYAPNSTTLDRRRHAEGGSAFGAKPHERPKSLTRADRVAPGQ